MTGYFIDNSLSYDLDAVQPFLFQGKAAMMLMGTFITAGFPANIKPQMGFFQFPIIDANVPTAEDGPVESLHIPSKAKNKADAHTFLAFMETPEISAQLAKGLGSLPANSKSPEPEDPISKIGFQILAQYEGRHRAVLRSRHDEGNGRRRHEGHAAVHIRSDATRRRCSAQLEATRKRIYKK